VNYFQLLGPFLLATFSISFFVIWRRFSDLRSTLYFALSYGSLAIALTLDWTRESFDPVAASYLTNIPYLSTVVFYAAGIAAFSNRPVPWRRLAAFVMIILVSMIWYRHVSPNLIGRTITMTFGVSGIMLFAVALSFPHTTTSLKKAILWCLALVSVLSLVRTILALNAEANTLTVETYTSSMVAWTLQLSMAMSALVVAVLLFAHYAITVMRRLTEENTRNLRRVEAQMSKFLSPSVVANLMQTDTVDLTVQKRPITALLVDLRGFTAFSDTHGSDAASTRANQFFATVTEEILARNGTIDKYLGDAVLAFWNAPLLQPDHTDLAIDAAKVIQSRLAEQRDPMDAVAMIETGECSVGNFGTRQRMDYTAIGGAMNIVSRLEVEAKARGIPLLIGPQAAAQTRHATIQVAQVNVAGIKEELALFSPT
jgi:class 3 adenylate cyclase